MAFSFKTTFIGILIGLGGYLFFQKITENPGLCPIEPAACHYTNGYYESRALFRDKAKQLGAEMIERQIKNDKVSDLTTDFAIFNKPQTKEQEKQPALVHISGTHGVEGYTGSAIQVAFFDEVIKGNKKIPEGVTVIFVHALNPFGFLFNRRWNENQVDLNRNILPEDTFPGVLEELKKIGTKGAYKDFEETFNLDHAWNTPLDDIKFLFIALYNIITKGFGAIKSAAVSGQYYNSDYIMFGGFEVQPSIKNVLEILRNVIPNAEKSIFIDVHTGLGPQGIDSLMSSRQSKQILQKGFIDVQQEDKAGIDFLLDTAFDDKKCINFSDEEFIVGEAGAGYELMSGNTQNLLPAAYQKKSLLITQEFGTYPGPLVLKAMVEESSYWNYNGTNEQLALGAKGVKRVFFPENAFYKRNTVRRGLVLLDQAFQVLKDSKYDELYPRYE